MVGTIAWAAAAHAGEIRPLQPRGKRLLEEGIHLSATFRLLTAEVAASDLVVYVDLSPSDVRTLDGATEFMATGGDHRFVRVWLRPARIDKEILATFGHELQHAVEIARNPRIVSAAEMDAFYRSAGMLVNPRRFET